MFSVAFIYRLGLRAEVRTRSTYNLSICRAEYSLHTAQVPSNLCSCDVEKRPGNPRSVALSSSLLISLHFHFLPYNTGGQRLTLPLPWNTVSKLELYVKGI